MLSRYHAGKPWSAIGPTWVSRPFRAIGGVMTVALALPANGATTAKVTPTVTDHRNRWFRIGLLEFQQSSETMTWGSVAGLT
ncbi:hypothetical protein L3i22_097040 [Actinoplanes sp. L3-i22]|nr:hypothetical protein L3i22_097040 [Actinoplanes sp. L3-i22]